MDLVGILIVAAFVIALMLFVCAIVYGSIKGIKRGIEQANYFEANQSAYKAYLEELRIEKILRNKAREEQAKKYDQEMEDIGC